MSAITGIVNMHRRIDFEVENIRKMTKTLAHRGKGIEKIKNCGFGLFGCASFNCNKDKEYQIPFSVKYDDAEYTICFDGLIYNSDDVKIKLKEKHIHSDGMCDTELVLNAYIKWGAGCLRYLNGIFAFSIWNDKTKELFLARDRFGIKPLYYTTCGDALIFASEIKGLLAHSSIDANLNKTGICEVLGLGPAHTQGTGVFDNIYEIMPSCFATFNKKGFNTSKYWQLVSKPYTENFEECKEEVRRVTLDAINLQLENKNRDMCFFLSGGLDSSIITALAANKYGDGIDTFSLKYAGNDEFFTPSEYQPESDDYYINLVSQTLGTNHHIVTVDNRELFDFLYDSMKARDLPGMADIDSSLYLLCKEMGSSFSGALSGECADEVFGGYPWFHRQEDFESNIFPWAKNIELRKNIVAPGLLSKDDISDYIYSKYNESIAECPMCRNDSPEEKRRREIAFLNLNWFMYTLGTRSERIGMNCGLEIRMPFCDHRIVELLWNVPWEYKSYNDREKGLLRMCFEEVLPKEVIWRKKSPFPKTHNPEYEDMVKNRLEEVLGDKNSQIHQLINERYIKEIMEGKSDYGKPWFGQLMATPQLYAYLIQLEMWLKEYKVKINC